jgi:hypothetical protein
MATPAAGIAAVSHTAAVLDAPPDVAGDTGNWLRADMGNRVYLCVGSEWEARFGGELLRRVFG